MLKSLEGMSELGYEKGSLGPNPRVTSKPQGPRAATLGPWLLGRAAPESGEGGTRTHNLGIMIPPLCQLSYLARRPLSYKGKLNLSMRYNSNMCSGFAAAHIISFFN